MLDLVKREGKMKLYDGGKVPNARRVRIYLAEKGLIVPLVPIDLGKLEHKSAEYTAINPLQRVPALVLDDGEVISESIAICRYFEELHPNPPLFGLGALGKARVEMWSRRVELELYLAVQAAFRHLHPAMAGLEQPQIPAWGEANKPRALAMMRFLDAELANRPFLAGDEISVADISAFVTLEFLKPARLEIPAELGHLVAWLGRFRERPSASA
jgi:glutathione S-transferase